MKNSIKELDVAFIGEQNKPLTLEEQLAISAFIKRLKEKQKRLIKTRPLKVKRELI